MISTRARGVPLGGPLAHGCSAACDTSLALCRPGVGAAIGGHELQAGMPPLPGAGRPHCRGASAGRRRLSWRTLTSRPTSGAPAAHGPAAP